MDIGDYMIEVKKIILLEQTEEEQCWQQYKKDGDEQARCRIIEAYQPLVFKCVRPFCKMDAAMDLVQEGTVGLIEAVERYDPDKNVAFSLYAVHRIKGRILNYLNKESAKDKYCSLYDFFDDVAAMVDDKADVQNQAEKNFLTGQVQKIMLRLPPKERAVLDGVYLKDKAPQELANNMQVSLSHVYRLQKMAVHRLRGMMAKFMHHWN
ncbi:sigma-70 family RNA polymerase sigma factor [Pectinatus cerevisiiphilus]|uniref:RNA polymerase sporulation-specific sigma factor n=1 Tax=Pectinatus cerevisiiphilus TaxID=86956 RepID=A0A4R3KBQ2_9FIRM|nr:sigma-70 family RNA polymerase sigma factor [Pectinatus cerevisiiphilus]TCS80498.1 RNA polymerase sporulation-specific sigma factor [Pectinatus cerevisiiphilus]